MPENPSPVSFALPERKSGESYVVTLSDGTTVVRTREQLARKIGK